MFSYFIQQFFHRLTSQERGRLFRLQSFFSVFIRLILLLQVGLSRDLH